jgi:putative restriction endonuclease
MNFWWVNHKRTFRQEFEGKYIWSPKRKRNGHINPFYETMREVHTGDIVFSFAGAAVRGFGIARTHCYSSPRPDEFGHIGGSWNEIGWRVDVDFQHFTEAVRPTLHMDALRPVLPQKYSPIKDQGYGNQNAYLAQIPRPMALVIAQLSSPLLLGIIRGIQVSEMAATPSPELRGIVEWEEHECEQISESRQLLETEKQALIKARRGQGLFRQNVARVEHFCRVTRVDRPEHLIASHIKPWRESDNRERLFEGNGLLLTATIDHLFDRGFISFENKGELLISPIAHEESMKKMGIIMDRVIHVGGFAEPQKDFLEFHRNNVFLKNFATPSH